MRSYFRGLPLRGLPLLAALIGCSAPEDENPAQRCSDELACPDGLVCYRSFCISDGSEPDDDSELDGPAIVPTFSTADAGLSWTPSGYADAALPDSGAAPVVTPPVVTPPAVMPPVVTPPVVTPPVVTPPVVTPPVDPPSAPIPAVDAGTTLPIADPGLPCARECLGADGVPKRCTECVKEEFGKSPEKLCASSKRDDDDDDDEAPKPLDPICIALCLGAGSVSPACAPTILLQDIRGGGGKSQGGAK